MAKLMTQHEFDKADLKGFKRETQNLILTALSVGWTGHLAERGNMTLRAPEAPQSIHLSKTSRSSASGPIQQLLRKVLSYGDPILVANLNGVAAAGVSLTNRPSDALLRIEELPADQIYAEFERQIPVDVMITLKRVPAEDIRGILHSFRKADLKYNNERDLALAVITTHNIYLEQQAVIKQAEEAEALVKAHPRPAPPKKRLVSSHPYMAHKSKGGENRPGRTYASGTVTEQKWSDGSVNYKCVLCPQESDTVIGITSHWKKHTNAGEVAIVGSWDRAGATLVEDPSYTENVGPDRPRLAEVEPSEHDYQPREDRVSALAAELLQAMEGRHGETPAEIADRLARRALLWAHEQRGNGVPRDPQTPEEILSAIRDMVDRGEYARMRQAALDAEQTADEALVRAERAESRTNKLGADLKALKDLLSTVGSDDEGDSD